jgi:spermidine synthase
MVDHWTFLEPLRLYFEGYDEVSGIKIKVLTMAIIPIFLMSLPTFIMGFSFSVSQNIIQNEYNTVGRKLGWLQFINIVGSTCGAWFASLIGFEILGTAVTLKILALVGLLYIGFSLYKNYFKAFQASIFTILLLACVFFIPGRNDFWRIASGVKNLETFVFSEDKTALSSIKIASPHSTVFVNGLGQSHFPMKDDYFHIMLGAVPTFLHPNPELVGIIGLGSAGTLYGASGREETKKMVCWEVIKSQPDVLYEFVKRTSDSSAYHILNDKRLDLRLVDGRKDLQSSDLKFDVLEADAMRPRSSYSGNLYSVEYFNLLKSKLKSGGIAVTWAPTERIKNSFRMVFPYVYQIQESLFIGSEKPLTFNKEVILSRFDNNFSKLFFDRAEIDAKAIMNNFINTLKIVQEGLVINSQDVNTDMWPKDEYELR